MSGLHPYCLVDAGVHPPAGLTGLCGRAVHGHELDAFTVWASSEERPPRVDLERVSEHHAVVRTAYATSTTLPVRFGAWAPDLEALTARVRERRDELEAAHRAVAGRAEFGVGIRKAAEPPGDAPPAPPYGGGRGYMRHLSRVHAARRDRRLARDRLLAALRRALDDIPVEERVLQTPPSMLMSVALLVPRQEEERLRERVGGFSREQGCAERLLLTGPWPPYSFAAP